MHSRFDIKLPHEQSHVCDQTDLAEHRFNPKISGSRVYPSQVKLLAVSTGPEGVEYEGFPQYFHTDYIVYSSYGVQCYILHRSDLIPEFILLLSLYSS